MWIVECQIIWSDQIRDTFPNCVQCARNYSTLQLSAPLDTSPTSTGPSALICTSGEPESPGQGPPRSRPMAHSFPGAFCWLHSLHGITGISKYYLYQCATFFYFVPVARWRLKWRKFPALINSLLAGHKISYIYIPNLYPSSITVMAVSCSVVEGRVPSRPHPATHVVVPEHEILHEGITCNRYISLCTSEN